MRVLFIALDAADKTCVQQWSDAGLLPNFQRLTQKSTTGTVANPPGLYVGAVWPSFATACHPHRHGRYCYRQFMPETYEFKWVGLNDVSGTYFWEQLDNYGKQVALVDIPKASPRKLKNGVQLVDWMTHDPAFDSRFQTWPVSLEARVRAAHGTDPLEGKCNRWPRETWEDYQYLIEAVQKRIQSKVEFASALWKEKQWDLFAVGFADAHCMGHQAWHIHDQDHFGHDPELRSRLGDPVLKTYIALDGALGEMMDLMQDDTVFVALASHGMGPHYDGDHLMTKALARINQNLDFGEAPPTPASDVPARGLEKSIHVPNNEAYLGIRVNLKGREPAGLIRAGNEFDSYLNALVQALLALQDTDDGEPVLADPIYTHQCYNCGHDHNLPDLMLRWSRRKPINGVRSDVIGEVQGLYQGIRSGDHLPDGRYWVSAPGLSPGEGERIRNIDLGPTIAKIIGQNISGADGRVVDSLVPDSGEY